MWESGSVQRKQAQECFKMGSEEKSESPGEEGKGEQKTPEDTASLAK